MIEKLIPDHIIGLDGLPTTIMPDSAKLMRKINELVDVVNEMASYVGRWDVKFIEPKIPADPYAKQRKWIGKLCRFWFEDKQQADLGILGEIDTDNVYQPYFNCDLGHHYKRCEPVKPDDDIIYKGDK